MCHCILDLEQLQNGEIAPTSAEESSSGAKRAEDNLVVRERGEVATIAKAKYLGG